MQIELSSKEIRLISKALKEYKDTIVRSKEEDLTKEDKAEIIALVELSFRLNGI